MNNKELYPLKAILPAILCLFCFLPLNVAQAHKAIIFAYVDGNKIVCEAKLSGGKKVRGGLIEVFDIKGTKLLEGKTDHQGHFSFEAPQKKAMKIVLHAGLGHRAEWIIPENDLIGPDSDNTAVTHSASRDTVESTIPSDQKAVHDHDCLTQEDVQRIVESALDRKLAAINKKISTSMGQDPDISDIIGGIGYILGLVGLAAYFNYRRKKYELEQ